MKIADLIIFTVTLTICFCFFRFFIEQTIKKYFKNLKYDTEKIERKLDSLERCRKEVRKIKEEFGIRRRD